MVDLVIDGKTLQAKDGQTILDVASAAKIYIPTLCNQPRLAPFGGCRLCLVKVEGMRNVVPACATPASEGMKVTTRDAEIDDLRRSILELILAEHPSGCIVCEDRELCFKYHREPQKAGSCTGCKTCPNMEGCELYRVAEKLGIKDIGIKIEYKDIPVRRDDPFMDRDYNICILCGRCVRVCDEIRGVYAIAFTSRSQKATIGTAFDKPLADSGCIFCGACIDVCPTGSLSEKRTKWGGKADDVALTTCILCPAGCSLGIESKWGRVMNVRPTERGHNGGQLCMLGRFCVPPLMNNSARIEYPMVRKKGVLVPVSWDEAYARAAEILKGFKPGQTGVVVSPWLTNEAGFLLQKFSRTVLGSDELILASPMAARAAAPLKMALGHAGPAGTVGDIAAADAVLVVGADMGTSAPVLLPAIYAAKKRGARVGFIGRAGRVPRYSDIAVAPADINAFLLEVLQKSMADAGNTLLPPGQGRLTAAEAETAAIVAGMIRCGKLAIIFGDEVASPGGERTVALLCNILANAGAGALIPAWDGGNVQGLLDCGANGKTSFGQNIKALYLTQPVDRIPEGVEAVILQDVYRSKMMDRADVVFPAASFTETEGTATSLERRVQRLARCVPAPKLANEDWTIISRLAAAMGGRGFGHSKAGDVTSEMFSAIPGMAMGILSGGGTLRLITDIGGIPACGPDMPFTGKGATYRGLPIREMVEDLDRVLSGWGVPK